MQNKHILVVEDEAKLRALMTTYLLQSKAIVHQASSQKEALTLFESTPIDLVVLDVMLESGDGWSVLRNIREKSHVPVIMVTSRQEESDKLFGFELGADDYVTKPFSMKELIARCQALLKRSFIPTQETVMRFSSITVDTLAHKAYIDDHPLDLSPKEYDLLVFFLNHPKQALSREQLLNGVWGYDYYGDLRTVDTHIKRLRQKLDPLNCIQTVRALGYRLEDPSCD